MARTTQTEIRAVFASLCDAVGPAADNWQLDYAPVYGGWTIVDIPPGQTVEWRPFAMRRLPAGEFVRAMHFGITAANFGATRGGDPHQMTDDYVLDL